MTRPEPAPSPDTSGNAAFAFVQELASALMSGKPVELPSFPDIALRVSKVLADENVTPAAVTRVVGSEPALAARIMQMANSSALGFSGKPVADIKTAITRVGFTLVRSAAIAFAMAQLRQADKLKPMAVTLKAHWERSSLVAAFANVVARRYARHLSDQALLAGLLHNVGKLYITTRAVHHPALFADQAAYYEIERDWHVQIAKALLEGWKMPEEIVTAVEQHEDLDRVPDGGADLTDCLQVAALLGTFHQYPESLELNFQGVRALSRLRIEVDQLTALVRESAAEIEQLRTTLGM